MNYDKLVSALRSASTVSTAWSKLMTDAADAIETLLSTNAWNEGAVKHLRAELDRLKGENE